ncbi:MAG: transglutaminase domain-containing protein [Vulcanimicrobiota bacterium]
MTRLWLPAIVLMAGCASQPRSAPAPPAAVATATPSSTASPSATPSSSKPDWAVLDQEEAPALPDWPPYKGSALEGDSDGRKLPAHKLRSGKSDASSPSQQHLRRMAWSGPRADYARLDARVAALADRADFSVESLAQALSALASDPELKFRAIYRWEAAHLSYDTDVLAGKPPVRSQWPEDVLRDRVAVCDGFARLYCALAQQMGLECETVLGYAKGPLVLHGDWGQPNHRWVRVRLPGGWALVDPTWSRAWRGGKDWAYQDQFFLMPPAQMLQDHWPIQPDWQLLTPALSFQAFTAKRKR